MRLTTCTCVLLGMGLNSHLHEYEDISGTTWTDTTLWWLITFHHAQSWYRELSRPPLFLWGVVATPDYKFAMMNVHRHHWYQDSEKFDSGARQSTFTNQYWYYFSVPVLVCYPQRWFLWAITRLYSRRLNFNCIMASWHTFYMYGFFWPCHYESPMKRPILTRRQRSLTTSSSLTVSQIQHNIIATLKLIIIAVI